MIDGEGVYGFVLHYALLFAYFGGALLVFLYLLGKKRLDFSEEIKYIVFQEDSDE
ncbi:MAG: hypothetical protein K940chlam9_01162 [Chlamydiae bacterium]|nr:hypothetical protein [Chlamydiota bacterium]